LYICVLEYYKALSNDTKIFLSASSCGCTVAQYSHSKSCKILLCNYAAQQCQKKV